MINVKRIIIPMSFASLVLAFALLALATPLSFASSTSNNQAVLSFPVLADYANDQQPTGFFTFGGEHPANVVVSEALSVTYNVTSFGGYGAVLSSTLGQTDWSAYNTISFDFTGTNSGATYTFQIQDGAGAVVERFVGTFVDDSAAAKTVTIPFADFVRSGGFQDTGAPNDGLQLTSMHAWLFDLSGSGSFQLDNVQIINQTPPPTPFPMLADYANGQQPSGFFTYGGENPANVVVSDALSVTYNVTSFGGYGAVLTSTLGQKDWSAYDAISFDFKGTNSGATYTFQIQDGSGAVVERFVATFIDDSTTSKTVTIPFADFVRSGGFQDTGAPDDGLQLTSMHAWLFDLSGSGSFMLDNVQVINQMPPPTPFPMLADYASGQQPSGFFTFGGENPAVVIVSDALSVTHNVTSFGGYGAVLTSTLGQKDWSAYNAISFDFTGTNSGATYTFQIQDGSGAVVERFNATFVDDSAAMKTVTLLFTDFARSTGFQDTGAPDDGLQITDMHAWLFDLAGSGSFQLDNVQVVNQFPPPTPFPMLADYANGQQPSGFFTYGGENPANVVVSDALSVTYNVTSFGGYGAIMTSTLGQRDWSAYDAISFDFTGTNSGATYTFQIQDGSGAVIERFNANFVDDSTTSKTVTIPFADFTRSMGFQDSGAPDDGLQITDMHAWLFDLSGSGSFMLDNVQVVTIAVPTVGFASSSYTVTEGTAAQITVMLSMTATQDVTVTVNSADGTATAGADYTAVISEQVVIPAGSTTAVTTVTTTDDSMDESNETVDLTLTSSNGATVATGSATLNIEDNDTTYKVYLPIVFKSQ